MWEEGGAAAARINLLAGEVGEQPPEAELYSTTLAHTQLQDVRALALELLPVLCVCLLGLALMLASAVRRKPKRD